VILVTVSFASIAPKDMNVTNALTNCVQDVLRIALQQYASTAVYHTVKIATMVWIVCDFATNVVNLAVILVDYECAKKGSATAMAVSNYYRKIHWLRNSDDCKKKWDT
jgi:hypothetical protein